MKIRLSAIIALVVLISFCVNGQSNDNAGKGVSTPQIDLTKIADIKDLYSIQKLILNPGKDFIENVQSVDSDSDDNIYVLDSGSNIFKFDSKGRLTKKLSKRGKGPGEYSMLVNFAIDHEGNIYCHDFLQSEIEIYNKEFKHTRIIKVQSAAAAAVIPPDCEKI